MTKLEAGGVPGAEVREGGGIEERYEAGLARFPEFGGGLVGECGKEA